MLKLIGLFIKLSLFAGVVLVLGHLVHWNGRSISDQIRTGLSQAERNPSVRKVKRTSKEIIEDAREAIHEGSAPGAQKAKETNPGKGSSLAEGIPHEEREELNALLDETVSSK